MKIISLFEEYSIYRQTTTSIRNRLNQDRPNEFSKPALPGLTILEVERGKRPESRYSCKLNVQKPAPNSLKRIHKIKKSFPGAIIRRVDLKTLAAYKDASCQTQKGMF